mgnify:CR=1 FL=1
MRTLLRQASLFVALLATCTLSAQTVTDHYIELTVSDTMSMKVERISAACGVRGK